MKKNTKLSVDFLKKSKEVKDKLYEDYRKALLDLYEKEVKLWKEICQKYDLEVLKEVWEECGFVCDEKDKEVKFYLNDSICYHYDSETVDNINGFLLYGKDDVFTESDLEEWTKEKYLPFMSVIGTYGFDYQVDHLDELVVSLYEHLETLTSKLEMVEIVDLENFVENLR